MDLGLKYLKRIFIYSSACLILFLVYNAFAILTYFNIVEYEIPIMVHVLASYDSIIIVGSIFAMMHFGAVTNYQYVLDILQLTKIKSGLSYVRQNLEIVMNPGYNKPDKVLKYEEEQRKNNEIFDLKNDKDQKSAESNKYLPTINSLYVRIFQKLLFAYKHEYPEITTKQLRKQLSNLMGEIDSIREKLEIDQEHQPLRIMGIKATWALLYQIYTGIATLVFAMGQKFLSDNGKSNIDL